MKYIGIVIFLIGLSGCAVLTESGAQVALIDAPQPDLDSCTYIDRIEESYSSTVAGVAFKKSRILLKNSSAEKSANLVLITHSARNIFPSGWGVVGNAYKCNFSDLRDILIHSQKNVFD
jgi:hypothetical protein